MYEVLRYFVYGWIILGSAIIVNYLVKKMNITTWYDFLVLGKQIGFVDGLFLFIIYPSIFGLIIYLLIRP